MERLKKERTGARTRFTKAKNELNDILATFEDNPQQYDSLKCSFTFFSQMAENLFDVDRRIQEQWLDEDTEEELDYATTDAYKKEWIMMEIKYSKIIQEHEHPPSKYDSMSSKSSSGVNKNRVFLPKLQLAKFDGNAKNWLGFWSSFKKIDNDPSMDDDDKMAYLVQSMTENTPAESLVKNFPPCGENYSQAVEQLKSRYARDELLVEIYVRELLSLVLQQAKETARMSIATLYDSLKTQLRALETLGVTSEKYAAMLYPLVESALPAEMLRVWERQRSRKENTDPLPGLLDFLKTEVESEERIQLTRQNMTAETEQAKVPTAACLAASNESTPQASTSASKIPKCIWCDKTSHSSHECYKPQKISLDARKELLNQKKACTICFKPGHNSKRCKSYTKCIACQKRHSVLMCPKICKPKEETVENTEHVLAVQNKGTTLLQTLLVKINGEPVRAFIDTGAQRSYIRQDIADKIKLYPKGEETLKHCLFGGVETKEECHKVYDLEVTSLNGMARVNMTALSKAKICGYIPRIGENSIISQKIKENQLNLTDIGKNTPEIGLLIGADHASKIMTGSTIHLDKDLYAIQTKLGWTLQGIVALNHDAVIASVGLTNDITQLWDLEIIGIEEPKGKVLRKKSEGETMKEFKSTVSLNEEGRYEVELPWKVDRSDLLENRELAEKRLRSTTKRLKSLNELQNYEKVFDEWLELDIIEREPDEDIPGHYLPHHAVIKESSLTTRVRPVFDASAKDANGNSINNCLEKGQNFLELIPILLTRFRMHAVGVTADIKKAFLQISIADIDRKFLRFLWWSDEGTYVVYRHRRVVFGLTCSPFLLAATLIYHLEKYSLTQYSQSADLLKNSFYVDNCVTSLKSQQEAEKFIVEAKHLPHEGKFELRGWITGPMQCRDTDKQTKISVLGMLWNPETDELQCNVNSLKKYNDVITKRELLSVCNRVFDPIGFTSPTTIIPKLMLQRTWSLNIGWDVKLPAELCHEFKTWLDEVHWLTECNIPRRLSTKPIDEAKNSLHMFSDASKHAYATCVFLRSESCNGETSVQLVLAKSRVTPVKEITIPRLELIAAVMSTRLYTQACEALCLENCKAYFWSDSSVALTWIISEKEWSVFVKNRVREITETTRREDWRHISGSLNPADLPSRGCSAKKLAELRWWEGPAWLKETEDKWPVSLAALFPVDKEEVNKELRATKVVKTNADIVAEYFSSSFDNISRYTRIIRTVAWIHRFINNCRRSEKTKGDVSSEEVGQAEKTVLRVVQGDSIQKSVRGMKNIETFEDKEGLIRVKTRLTLSEEEESFKFPILLPNKLLIVRRLVEEKHRRHLHAGLHTLTSILRNDFWILGGKRLVRNVISNCTICKRYKAESYKTASASLPKNRINNTAPFQVTGVDAAGPLLLNTGEKCWLILFTCAVYRAVHLELVMSMSTDCFIMALRRFIARRGRVQIIYSDNGTNFVGTANLLSSCQHPDISPIKWIFNPPAAPWWGGWWERLIQMVKQLLRQNLGKSVLNFVELETILCDIESVVNSRPLTYVSEDDTLRPLTPASFLRPLPETGVSILDEVDAKNLRVRQQYLQKLRIDLRQRFRSEYLSLLVSRSQKANRSIQVGEVVLVEAETKRMNWPLGLVVDIYPGKDGQTRVAKIKTSDGFRIRPIQRLYPLEVQETEDEAVRADQAGPSLRTRSGRHIKVPRKLDL